MDRPCRVTRVDGPRCRDITALATTCNLLVGPSRLAPDHRARAGRRSLPLEVAGAHGPLEHRFRDHHDRAGAAGVGDHPGRPRRAGQPSTTSDPATADPVTTSSAPGAAEGAIVDLGYLQPPQNASATYPASSSGTLVVTAIWSTSTTLSLVLTCAGTTTTSTGRGSVVVTWPAPAGNCAATFANPKTRATLWPIP